MKGDEFLESYRWLRDALLPQCDEVRMEVFDFGQVFVVAVGWGKGDNRVRTAIRVEYGYHVGGEWISVPSDVGYHVGGEWISVPSDDADGYTTGYWEGGKGEHYSLNKNIVDGKITREQVIDSFVSKRPEGWKK